MGKLFDKVLVANRGEIACRVFQTCRRLGIGTVAVYSTADRHARHVQMADEAICVGPAPSVESYLKIDAIIDACLKHKVNAVHPGYGFLSENFEFSAALAKNNLIFVGPDAHSIKAMGDKIESKKLAEKANVAVIPGYNGEIATEEELLSHARSIGYPVMIKASAGGGGKGMGVAWDDKGCIETFHECRAVARSAFGDDRMLVEKFVTAPRHIEIQVIADRRGNTLYFPERECSVQRRNQKVIEEAPSTFIDPETRKAMGEQAKQMAKAVDYVTAGTVEMVVDPKRNFYFLEMNTRLQVEHPITELITGVDLVEQMFRAAAGLELSIKQKDIQINGWATEARVYAEDPLRNYLPSIGRLKSYVEPKGEGVRVDTGIKDGSEISVYYDPMICKLCTWGKDRPESLSRMRRALDQYVIRGLSHNSILLRDVIGREPYIKGNLTTAILDELYPDGFVPTPLTHQDHLHLLVGATLMKWSREFSHQLAPSTNVTKGIPQSFEAVVYIDGARDKKTKLSVAITKAPNLASGCNVVKAVVSPEGNASPIKVELAWTPNHPIAEATFSSPEATTTETIQYIGSDSVDMKVQFHATIFDVYPLSPEEDAVIDVVPKVDASKDAKKIHSPMPGVIVEIGVKVGDTISAGTELMTLEAMKMRNKLHSEVDGVVKTVHCKLNETVEDAQILLELE